MSKVVAILLTQCQVGRAGEQQHERANRQRQRRRVEDVRAPAVLLPADQLLGAEADGDEQELEGEPLRHEPQEQVDAEDDRKRAEAERVAVAARPRQQHVEGVGEQELRRHEWQVVVHPGASASPSRAARTPVRTPGGSAAPAVAARMVNRLPDAAARSRSSTSQKRQDARRPQQRPGERRTALRGGQPREYAPTAAAQASGNASARQGGRCSIVAATGHRPGSSAARVPCIGPPAAGCNRCISAAGGVAFLPLGTGQSCP